MCRYFLDTGIISDWFISSSFKPCAFPDIFFTFFRFTIQERWHLTKLEASFSCTSNEESITR